MRTQLTDFAAEFMTEVEVKERLKEVFEKHMGTARVAKNAGNYETNGRIIYPSEFRYSNFRTNKKERLLKRYYF